MSKILHPLIIKTKNELNKLDSENVKTWGERHSYKGRNLSISVEPKLRNRAFNFMNELLSLLEKNNHSIKIDCNRSQIEMYGQLTEFNLRQKFYRKRVKEEGYSFSHNVFVKSEDLEFQVGYSYRKGWIDKKTKKIEDDIQSIFEHIEKKSKYYYEIDESNKIAERKREQEKLLEQERERLVEVEDKKVELLLQNASNYKKANEIRFYIKALEKKYSLSEYKEQSDLDYIKWATKKANELDPLVEN
ncbi:hypothetical protein [Polaribacter sp. HaHaR_3_91]|uniref:hypothetical protein n=2 Tax=unclassified Polaribacter TaxID=196858 RepID=UPI001C4EA06D|nr:hypothetical protein [Polaribacter sp. HaHaR_3_91]QXP63931.1 hypothetical protein H0I27_01650 [Polaribacter sp. HaHaR_3_91]